MTSPGDIVVSPASGKLLAAVDEKGGHVVASPLQVVRIDSELVDPEVAALFLASPRNRRFATGTAYARIDARKLELPILSRDDANRIGAAINSLSSYEDRARQVMESVRALREVLVDA